MTDRNPSLPPSMEPEYLSGLEADFYIQYARTLAAWARLEQTLGKLFCVLCALRSDSALGRELFFSGRSFQTRIDLLSAAIRIVELPEEVKVVLRALRKKARDYSGARNKIAHGYPTHMAHMDVDWQGWRVKEGEKSHLPGGIGLDELKAAMWNFNLLETAAEDATSLAHHHLQGIQMPPEERLELVQSLPPDAFLPSQYQTEEEQRQRDAP